MNQIKALLQGLNVDQNQPDRTNIMRSLIAGEKDPDMLALLIGAEPVASMPGYYWNEEKKMLFKYNPNANLKPTLLDINYTPTSQSQIILPRSE